MINSLLKISFVIFIFVSVPFITQAQENVKDSTQSESSYIFLPAIYYTPETEWAGGIVFQYYFYRGKKDSLSRPSSFIPIFIYTQKKQVISELGFDIYFDKQNYHLFGQIGYQKFPNSFYGIGNNVPDESESYTPKKFYSYISFFKKFYPGTNMGIKLEFENTKFSSFDPDGVLKNLIITGTKNGTASGFGIIADYDNRDNIYYASKGSYYQFSAIFFGNLTGSDYTFSKYNFDLRKYYSLYKDHILALHTYAEFISGNAPFYKLAGFGGSTLMRGYYDGRFRDKNVLVLQTEYRKHIWYRLGLVLFGGVGQVAPKISTFQLNEFRYTAGFGFRFMIDEGEKLNLRFDYGVGNNTSGIYMQISEAF